MFETEAFKALGAYPIVQFALAILIVGGGAYAIVRGQRDRNGAKPEAMPQWAMFGPIHDAMTEVHRMGEQSRATNHILSRIEEETKGMGKEQREQTQLLEDIRNSLVLRGDPSRTPRGR